MAVEVVVEVGEVATEVDMEGGVAVAGPLHVDHTAHALGHTLHVATAGIEVLVSL